MNSAGIPTSRAFFQSGFVRGNRLIIWAHTSSDLILLPPPLTPHTLDTNPSQSTDTLQVIIVTSFPFEALMERLKFKLGSFMLCCLPICVWSVIGISHAYFVYDTVRSITWSLCRLHRPRFLARFVLLIVLVILGNNRFDLTCFSFNLFTFKVIIDFIQ